MGARERPFQYAIVRVVPRVERGECMNVGVVFFCRPRRYLAARMALDEARLAAFAPELDLEEVRAHLDAMDADRRRRRRAPARSRSSSSPSASTGWSRRRAR